MTTQTDESQWSLIATGASRFRTPAGKYVIVTEGETIQINFGNSRRDQDIKFRQAKTMAKQTGKPYTIYLVFKSRT